MRTTLSNDSLTPEAAKAISSYHSGIVSEVADAVEKNKVVVVGMVANPFVKRARKALEASNVPFKYIEVGSYVSKWKERLAIKLWSGWPTYPQVFVNGKLVGGAVDLEKFIQNGQMA
ncbi:MAG: glutaredoxin domain-containing protein [Bdellovibrionota bacterium]